LRPAGARLAAWATDEYKVAASTVPLVAEQTFAYEDREVLEQPAFSAQLKQTPGM
jgi:hypothetical protein